MIDPLTNTIIGESLIGGEAIAGEFRAAIVSQTVKSHKAKATLAQMIRKIAGMGLLLTPIFAESFWRSDLAAWLSAYEYQTRNMPEWLQTHLSEIGRAPPGGRPPLVLQFDHGRGPEKVVFPKIQKAAASLIDRAILRRDQFDILDNRAKAKAFTIAGDLTERAISKVRDALSETINRGDTLKEFEKAVEKSVGKAISPSHVENVYRTNLQAAFRDGRESVVSNPIIAEVFPYQEYIAVHDARARHTHQELEKLGLSGTNIYRRDDPFWDYFSAPWDFNCRCGSNLLTIEAAARRGVLEAQKWIDTGRPPTEPEHRLSAIPFESNPGFGQRSGVLVV